MLRLNPDELIIDWAANGRWKASEVDVSDLIQSIREHGQIEPIEVRKRPDGKYIVTLGFRRTMAIKAINHLKQPGDPKMPILAVERGGINTEEAFRRNIEENMRRRELTPMDIAEIIRRWQNVFHKSQKEIADIFGRTQSWISGHLKLLTLEPREQQMIHDGSLSIWAGVELARFTEDVRSLLIHLLQEDDASKTLTKDDVIRKGREMGKLHKLRKRSRKEIMEDLTPIAESPAYMDMVIPVQDVVRYVLEYFNGEHNLDDLHKFITKRGIESKEAEIEAKHEGAKQK